MKPIFKVSGHDYTAWLSDEGLKPSRNDIDADGSGRNLLDGLMYRDRITSKKKWTVTFNRVNEIVAAQLLTDMYPEYVHIRGRNSIRRRPLQISSASAPRKTIMET